MSEEPDRTILSRVNNPPERPPREARATLDAYGQIEIAISLQRHRIEARSTKRILRLALTVGFLHFCCTWASYRVMKTSLCQPYLCEHQMLANVALNLSPFVATWICSDFWRSSRHPRLSRRRWLWMGLRLAMILGCCEVILWKWKLGNYCTVNWDPNYRTPELLILELTANNGTDLMGWTKLGQGR